MFKGEKRTNNIGALDPVIYRKLCDKLNQRLDGKDYSTLASKMQYGVDVVKSFEKSGNATDAMLTHWKTKSENSLHKLIKFLNKMDRADLVNLLGEAREESFDSSSDEEGDVLIVIDESLRWKLNTSTHTLFCTYADYIKYF